VYNKLFGQTLQVVHIFELLILAEKLIKVFIRAADIEFRRVLF